ncbi:unnamed protein product [Porites evermanni]|uniref:Uncharacterized protein n=1 Tax=Porites evermanni TaxID=104178 RepID=A0ABN8QYY9_9CNID|nr:unnamed protein product [Porites evermanni]
MRYLFLHNLPYPPYGPNIPARRLGQRSHFIQRWGFFVTFIVMEDFPDCSDLNYLSDEDTEDASVCKRSRSVFKQSQDEVFDTADSSPVNSPNAKKIKSKTVVREEIAFVRREIEIIDTSEEEEDSEDSQQVH